MDVPTRPEPVPAPPRSGRVLAFGLLGLALLGVLWSGIQEARHLRPARSGQPAPPFVFEKLGGGEIRSADLRGQVVMLDYWATWCPPCVAELPTLVRLAREYEGKGVRFVAANRDDPDIAKVQVALFVDQRAKGLGPYVGFADDRATDAFEVRALPTMIFLDREGRVHASFIGAGSEAQWRARIESALAAP